MNSCPFCDPEVISKQKLFETTKEFVLYNIRKTNRGRCLVIPKRHVVTLRELSDDELNSLVGTVKLVSTKLKSYLHPAGINYGFNEGIIAGQMIPHFHIHILPRFNNDHLMPYHLFHGNPKLTKDLNDQELTELVTEFSQIF
jgi:histidine triad (HIT) family protein